MTMVGKDPGVVKSGLNDGGGNLTRRKRGRLVGDESSVLLERFYVRTCTVQVRIPKIIKGERYSYFRSKEVCREYWSRVEWRGRSRE